MSPQIITEGVPLFVIFCVTTFGVCYRHFLDNLVQRVGLSLLACGSALKIVADVQQASGHAGALLLVYGAAIYAVGCVVKLYRHPEKL